MTTDQQSEYIPKSRHSTKLYVIAATINLAIMLLPPIYLGMTSGGAALAIGYFMGLSVILLISLWALNLYDSSSSRAGSS